MNNNTSHHEADDAIKPPILDRSITENMNNSESTSSSSSSFGQLKENKSPSSKRIKLFVAILILGLIIFVIVDSKTNRYVMNGMQSLMTWVKNHPVPGFFAFTMTCFLGTLFFIPGIVLTLGAGFIFSCAFNLGLGLVLASLSVFLGCSFGAIASFYLGRYLLRSYVKSWTERYPKFEAIDSALSCKGFRIMSLLRLSPVIPFNALNYIAGVTAISSVANTCSLIAILPGTVLYVFLGGTAGTLVEGGGGVAKWVSLGIGILFGILGVVAISFYAKKELRNVMERRMVHCHSTDVEVGEIKGDEIKVEEQGNNK